VTKPAKIGVGIGVAALACALLAVATGGLARVAWAWTAVACGVACGAYVANRPAWLGKRRGRLSPSALVLGPYLVAFRVACAIMRRWREPETPTHVAPGLWVAGRVRDGDVPAGVTHVVDLVAEYSATPGVRRRAGYRSLPVLDGGVPADVDAFVALVRELVVADGDVLVHCDSGRGRAPTMAAALLIARGLAADAGEAIAVVCSRRPVAAPTRSDRAFLARAAPALRAIARAHASRADAAAW
jgi:rhodanese/phosphatase family protein